MPVAFVAGQVGTWRVDRVHAVIGEGLPLTDRLDVVEGGAPGSGVWVLRDMTSNTRYTTRPEVTAVGGAGRVGPTPGEPGDADPDPQDRGVVGAGAGRAPGTWFEYAPAE